MAKKRGPTATPSAEAQNTLTEPKAAPLRPPTAGSWQPGHSGNPGGRPKEVESVKTLARQRTDAAIRTLEVIAEVGFQVGMRSLFQTDKGGQPLRDPASGELLRRPAVAPDRDDAAAMRAGAAAAEALLCRGWGRPAASLEVLTPRGGLILVTSQPVGTHDPLADKSRVIDVTPAPPSRIAQALGSGLEDDLEIVREDDA